MCRVQFTSANLRKLDALLNDRVTRADSSSELDHWLRAKTRIKQRLASLADEAVEETAAKVLRDLEDLDDEISAVGGTFGPEIADSYAETLLERVGR